MITLSILLRKQGYTSVLKALRSYPQSAGQAHLHSYIHDQSKLSKIKKNIDYKTINASSKGKFMIRQYLFQQRVEQNYIPPLGLYMMPHGKWTRADLVNLKVQMQATATQFANQDIIKNCQEAFLNVFKKYYKQLGKGSYNFILSQQIGKIAQMSPEQFQKFVNTVKGDQVQVSSATKSKE